MFNFYGNLKIRDYKNLLLFPINMEKEAIERTLKGRGIYVQIDYLREISKKNLSISNKIFVYEKLGELYQQVKMLKDAAHAYDGLAIVSVSFVEKMKNYVKEAQLYIMAGEFERAEEAMNKAMAQGNASEKAEIYFAIKQFYRQQGAKYEKETRRANAARIYERLLQMSISTGEREEIREKLLNIYEKLGDVKRYFSLKRSNIHKKPEEKKPERERDIDIDFL